MFRALAQRSTNSTGSTSSQTGATTSTSHVAALKSQFFEPAAQQQTPVQTAPKIKVAPTDHQFYQDFRSLATSPDNIPKIKELFRTHDFDPMLPDEEGDNALHYAALAGNGAFFDFIMTDPIARAKKMDINSRNLKENTNVLSLVIGNRHFDVALRLIRQYGADVRPLVRDTLFDTKDNTVSLLRVAFSLYFCKLLDNYSDEKKATLNELCKELLKKLKFFSTPGSHCPPAFLIGMRRFEIEERHEQYMLKHNINKNQLYIIQNLWLLEKRCPELVKLLGAEAINTSNSVSQDILQTWSWYILNGRPKIELCSAPKPY